MSKSQIALIFSGRTHKENESIADCQDYYGVNGDCFAIADGSSQSFYPSIWAEMLVNKFCQNPEINDQNWQEWLLSIQKDWLVEVEERVRKAKLENKPIWVTNQNRLSFRESSTSTFIGLQFISDCVKVCLVGDSCLFILNDQKLVKSYPVENSIEFSDRPEYLASYAKDNSFTPNFFEVSSKFGKQLHFILATDALSEYIFKCCEQGEDIFPTLLNISSQQEFEHFVATTRNSSSLKMKNDDVTLVVLKLVNRSGLKDFNFPKLQVSNYVRPPKIAAQANIQNPTVDGGDMKSDQLDSINTLRLENAKLSNNNRNLKRQRFILATIVLIILSFMIVNYFQGNKKTESSSPTPSQNTPKCQKIQNNFLVDKWNDFKKIFIRCEPLES